MALGPEDKESSQADDVVMFFRTRLAVLCEQLGILFRLFGRIGFGMSKGHGIAAEQDVDTSARHVGGNSDRAFPTRLSDDLRFLLVILRVQHLMLDAKLLQLVAQHFGLLDGTCAHEHRLSGLVFWPGSRGESRRACHAQTGTLRRRHHGAPLDGAWESRGRRVRRFP